MFLDYNTQLKGQKVLINSLIHKKAKLSKQVFLDRIKNIKNLRTAFNSNYISFYITSVEEYTNLIKFHDLINKGIFDFTQHEIFAISIEPKLYNWFKNNSINTIQKQITCWMAGSYYYNKDIRAIQQKQVYKPLFEEILNIIEKYYKDIPIPNFSDLTNRLHENGDDTIFEEQKKCVEEYNKISVEYCKSELPEFLKSPFGYEIEKEWGVNDRHNFEFIQAYMNENDWNEIILQGDNQANMLLAESRDELWLKWKQVYITYDEGKNYVYSFYYESSDLEINQSKQKREAISLEIKKAVWNRDNGKCVECYSNEKLEFDHIIPFSKGGSSTFRNIQLLCEPCNRKKHANL